MFNKKHDKIETLIGANTHITGKVELKGTLRVDGRFDGNITADWVVVGESGHVKGQVYANGVAVGGLMEGNVNAREYIEIMPSGKLLGDVLTLKLAIMEGGLFEGRSRMQKPGKKEAISIVYKDEAVEPEK
jgi:cytoskeletal protein CcmA (bactofilin family)